MEAFERPKVIQLELVNTNRLLKKKTIQDYVVQILILLL